MIFKGNEGYKGYFEIIIEKEIESYDSYTNVEKGSRRGNKG